LGSQNLTFFPGKPEHEVIGKTLDIPVDIAIEDARLDTVERG
jgi:hypothetical protein